MTISDVTSGTTLGRWLPFKNQAGAGTDALALYCLPHAGGGASAYRSWLGRLPGIAVLPVQPPGRENRFRDEPHEKMESLIPELADAVLADVAGESVTRGPAKRYAIYGHSLGALVAFELVRELRRRDAPGPVHLFVSGCVAPHRPFDDGPPVRGMSRPELVNLLRNLGGTPDWLLSDPSVLEMILPAVRADFSVKETYSYQHESTLDVPITTLPSTEDPRASVELVNAWRELTTGEFDSHTFMGGHFAVFEQAALTLRYISAALRKWLLAV